MDKQEMQQEALARATTNQSLSNYTAIYEAFMERGIPESEIRPRENVFTYNAWKALGRQVMKGEHGVKVITWKETSKQVEDPDTGEIEQVTKRWPKKATVFHISQTKVIE